MDWGFIINVVFGLINAGFFLYNINENKKNTKFQKKLALYDKRVKVWSSVNKYIAHIFGRPMDFTHEKVVDFLRNIDESKFLFDDELLSYLEELKNKGLDYISCNEQLDAISEIENDREVKRTKLIDCKYTIINWFQGQYSESERLFSKYLDLTKE